MDLGAVICPVWPCNISQTKTNITLLPQLAWA